MKRAMKSMNVFLLLLCGLWSVSSWAAIQATVSQNPVYVGELFTLEVEADESLDPDELSTKALEAYFDVFRPSVSRQKSYVNGTFTSTTRWTISLMAKQAGKVEIPALSIAGQSTLPIALEVLDNQQQSGQQQGADPQVPQDVLLEAHVDHASVYVGQQLIYTVELYIGAMLENASLTNPELSQADVAQMGQDEKQVVVKNGVKYQKITRRFAITANQSGQLTIQGPRLTGELYKTVSQTGYRPRTVRQVLDIQAQAINLTVKAKPASVTGQAWLVSDEVMLSEELQNNATTMTVGQPITRTFTLIAANSSEKSLPTITFNYPDAVRIYPDKDEVSGFIHQGTAFAQRISSHAIIAEQPGELVLPEVTIPWWNSQTDQLEYAKVAERKIMVVANDRAPEEAIPTIMPAAPTVVSDAGIWPYVSLGLGICWLITLALYWRKPKAATKPVAHVNTVTSAPLQHLLACAKTNQAAQTWQALLAWSHAQWPQIKSVSQLPVSAELNLAIMALQQAIATQQPWQGKELITALQQQQDKTNKPDTLAPLNPL